MLPVVFPILPPCIKIHTTLNHVPMAKHNQANRKKGELRHVWLSCFIQREDFDLLRSGQSAKSALCSAIKIMNMLLPWISLSQRLLNLVIAKWKEKRPSTDQSSKRSPWCKHGWKLCCVHKQEKKSQWQMVTQTVLKLMFMSMFFFFFFLSS